MPYNSVIGNTEGAALVPEQVAAAVIGAVVSGSVTMQLGTRLPNMSAKQLRMPVASALATAYFVNGRTGLKQTTSIAWSNKYVEAEEIAVIVPIAQSVIDDSGYPIWDQIQGQLTAAIAKTWDMAVLLGTNAPAAWPTGLVPGATAAGNTVTFGAVGDLYDDLFADTGVLGLLEDDGFIANGHVAAINMRGKLRKLRATDGQPLYTADMRAPFAYGLDGTGVTFPLNNCMDPTEALLVSGDWSQLVWAVRQDITFRIFDTGVITDEAGLVIYNLMQQDMVAMRCVMRGGWQLPNPINQVNTNAATRYPFSVLVPA